MNIPTTYHLLINERQRVKLLRILKDSGEDLDVEDHPLQYWIDCLEKLPEDEQEHPGVLHGFCL